MLGRVGPDQLPQKHRRKIQQQLNSRFYKNFYLYSFFPCIEFKRYFQAFTSFFADGNYTKHQEYKRFKADINYTQHNSR